MFKFLRRKTYTIESLSKDILEKLEIDFSTEKEDAVNILNKALKDTEYLRNERVIRCIIFLANSDLSKLKECIETARQDTRDVMYWAEYIQRESLEKNKRIRNFNKRFDQNDLTIKE